jgi:hypothetical protein
MAFDALSTALYRNSTQYSTSEGFWEKTPSGCIILFRNLSLGANGSHERIERTFFTGDFDVVVESQSI